jgi:hypothetical protein
VLLQFAFQLHRAVRVFQQEHFQQEPQEYSVQLEQALQEPAPLGREHSSEREQEQEPVLAVPVELEL